MADKNKALLASVLVIIIVAVLINYYIRPKPIEDRWSDFEAKYGEKWDVEVNEVNDVPHTISGSNIEIEEPVTESNADALSRDFFKDNKALFKIDDANLELLKTDVDPPLYPEHTGGVVTTTYRQVYKEIPVYKSLISATYINGKLTTATTDYYPGIDVSPTPGITEQQALEIVKADLGITENINAKDISLWIFPEESDGRMIYHLTWKVDMPLLMPEKDDSIRMQRDAGSESGAQSQIAEPPEQKPSEWVYFVDAHNKGVVYRFNNIIYETLSGRVRGNIFPVHPQEAQEERDFKSNTVSAGEVTAVTDSNGYYQIDGLSGSVNLASALRGPYARIADFSGTYAQHTTTLSVPTTHDWSWAGYDASDRQEQSNLFYHLNFIHDFFTRGAPFDIHEMDYQSFGVVQYPGTCNAFADGTDTYYFGESAGCENTALMSDVIYHEYTHLVTAHLISNFPYWDETGHMNEGFSDYFAASIHDDPCIGEYFFKTTDCLRDIDNTARYPENYNPEPHGIIFPAALWDLREAMILSEGLGRDLADSLVIRTMKLQPHSFSEFMDLMIITDDDNGDLTDGTPHITQICQAFYDNHGFASENCAGYTAIPMGLITSPETKEIITSKDKIIIEGTVSPGYGNTFQKYDVHYIKYNFGMPGESLTQGITLTGGGQSTVEGGVLAEWDISGLESGMYDIRLTVTDSAATTGTTVRFYIDKELKSGWPIDIGRVGTEEINSLYFESSPAISDINNDGYDELLIETGDGCCSSNPGRIYVYDHQGNQVFSYFTGSQGLHTPAIGEFDSDESYIIQPSNYLGLLYLIDKNGEPVTGWPKTFAGTFSSAIFYDVDNDGLSEIIYMSSCNGGTCPPFPEIADQLNIIEQDGSYSGSCPVTLNAGDWAYSSTPPVGDINGDGYKEILVRGNDHLYVFDYQCNLLQDPPMPISSRSFFSSLKTADFDNDGKDEVFILDQSMALLEWDDETQSLVEMPGWPKAISLYRQGAYFDPAIGDVNGDGLLEIVVGYETNLQYDPNTGRILENKIDIYDYNGNLINSWLTSWYGYPASVSLGDVNDDGNVEAVEVNYKGIYIWSTTGEIIFYREYPPLSGTPVIGDIDKDGITDIIAGPYAWSLGSYRPYTLEWPQYQHDPQHTGLYTGVVLPNSVINNTGANDVNGKLNIEVQKYISGNWETHQAIVSSQEVTIPPNSFISLNTYWNNAGGFTAAEAGSYRVYAELTDMNDAVLVTKSYDFTVG